VLGLSKDKTKASLLNELRISETGGVSSLDIFISPFACLSYTSANVCKVYRYFKDAFTTIIKDVNYKIPEAQTVSAVQSHCKLF
jgi:formaldehyde-activating enzyme involved in methanogenesis